MTNGLKVISFLAALGATATACNCGSQSGPSPNGIFRSSATTISDTCTPRACEGDGGFVAVTSLSATSIRVPISPCFGNKRGLATQYQDVPAEYAVFNSCGTPIGRETLTLEQAGPPVVIRISTQLDAGDCGSDGGLGRFGSWPDGACSVDQRVTFDLIQECQPPCVIMLRSGAADGGAGLTCKCP